MKTDERLCSDAAFDVMVARALTTRAARPGDTVSALPTARADRVRRPAVWPRLLAALLAVVVVFAVARTRDDTGAAPAQEPAQPPASVPLVDADELLALAKDLRGAHAEFVQVVSMVFPIGAGGMTGGQVDYVEVPDARVDVDDGEQLLQGFVDAFRQPAVRSGAHQDALLDVHLRLTSNRVVTVRCHRTRDRLSISCSALGLRHVEGDLADRLLELMQAAKHAAARTFVFAVEPDDLDNAADTTTQLVSYGVGDDGLAELQRMRALRRVELVGRRLDEYPQQYDGVPVTAKGLQHLAGCQQLERLKLVSARLDDDALLAISGLTALRELVIDDGRHCTFTARGLGLLANLPQLERVRIEGCFNLKDDALAALARSRTLRDVELEACDAVRGAGVASLFAAPALRRLELAEVDVEGVVPRSSTLRELELRRCAGRIGALDGLPALRRLELSSVSIGEAVARSLAKTDLRRASFHRCASLAPLLPQVAALPGLEQLMVTGMRGAVDWPGTFAALRGANGLRRLLLFQCGLRDDDARHLRHLTQLRQLDLRLNKVSAALVEQLRGWLPDARVLVDV